jgi:hypothetical protein
MSAWYARRDFNIAEVGLLPDFYAGHARHTGGDGCSRRGREAIEKVAAEARPAEGPDALTLAPTVPWVRLRVELVRVVLIAVLGLFPSRFGTGSTLVRTGAIPLLVSPPQPRPVVARRSCGVAQSAAW